MEECKVKQILKGQYVMEGAGVRLKRLFGFQDTALTDPFLLFDHFGSKNPAEYLKGFPWHPHRGMETVTYMISGQVEHQDSLGNSGIISPGDAQWMTAGSGIIHQEMPLEAEDSLSGFQLWVNLPKTDKMGPPRYRDIKAGGIPVHRQEGISIKVLSGRIKGTEGASRDISGDPIYADIFMEAGCRLELPVPQGYKAFCYFFQGEFLTGGEELQTIGNAMVIFTPGDGVTVQTKDVYGRFIFFAGAPLNEPVAWQGPIVMNTRDELETAFKEFREGTFIKKN